jgi:hypothetical protein
MVLVGLDEGNERMGKVNVCYDCGKKATVVLDVPSPGAEDYYCDFDGNYQHETGYPIVKIGAPKVDVGLLREQRNFLLTYPWIEGNVPELVEGLVNFIEYEMDERMEE